MEGKKLWIRHIGFYVAMYLWLLLFFPLFAIFLLLPKKYSIWFPRFWNRIVSAFMSFFLQLRYRVQGREHLPLGQGYILASKHQSTWETLSLNEIIPYSVFFFKRSLLHVPFAGWFLWKIGMIPVSRDKNQKMFACAYQMAIVEKRSLILFPEGTRTPPGKSQPYHTGIYNIYRYLGIPVVPVALNSGFFWPRRTFFKKAGTIDLVFLPPILPGLSKKEFMETLSASIEGKSQELLEQAIQEQSQYHEMRSTV